MSIALVGIETKLVYVFNGSEAKYWDYKDDRLPYAIILNDIFD